MGVEVLQYRLLLAAKVGAHDVSSRLDLAWSMWLKHKQGLEIEAARSISTTSGISRLNANRIQTRTVTPNGAFRMRLFETTDTGRWTSTLTWVPVTGPGSVGLGISGWVELTVELDQSGMDEPPVVRFAPPRIRRYLMEQGEWVDLGESVQEPIYVGRNQSPALVKFIADNKRKLPAIVCSPPIDGAGRRWDAAVQELAAEVRGSATVWVLDHEAQTKFAERIGHDLSVWGGAVRTYVPNLQGALEGVKDSRSVHKVLRWEMLRDQTSLAARIVATACRDSLLEATPWTPAPKSLNSLVIDVADVPSLADDPSLAVNRTYQRSVLAEQTKELDEAKRVIDALVAEVADLRSRNALAAEQASLALELGEDSERKLAAVNKLLAEADEEAALLLEELEAGRHRELSLKNALAWRDDSGKAVKDALASDPADDYSPAPTTFDELLEYLELMPEVEFTGDRGGPEHLWQQQTRKTILNKTWETALAMAAYARAVRAGRFTGTFHRWCDSEDDPVVTRRLTTAKPDGGGRVASTESFTVQNNDEMRRRRTFPVPVAVDERGKTEMYAHVKLGVGSTFPRLHYIEHNGTVYIGYIGPHLPNTKT